MGYVHINDLFQAIEFPAKDFADKSENVTVNSITNDLKRSYAGVWKASKNKDVKEGERKDIRTQNIHK